MYKNRLNILITCICMTVFFAFAHSLLSASTVKNPPTGASSAEDFKKRVLEADKKAQTELNQEATNLLNKQRKALPPPPLPPSSSPTQPARIPPITEQPPAGEAAPGTDTSTSFQNPAATPPQPDQNYIPSFQDNNSPATDTKGSDTGSQPSGGWNIQY